MDPGGTSGSGAFTCGLDTSGKAYCWGNNGYQQLGLGKTRKNPRTPTPVATDLVFHAISSGFRHTCGIADLGDGSGSGPAYCWGDNYRGQLGDGSGAAQGQPVPVAPHPETGQELIFSTINTGVWTSCGIVDTGDGSGAGPAFCWGWNYGGQLGDGSTVDSPTPVEVIGGHSFTMIGTGVATCGLTAGGFIYCWGHNDYGEVGDGTTIDRSVPTSLATATISDQTFKAVMEGCAIGASDQAYCWGPGINGQLGNGEYSLLSEVPVPVAAPGTFRSIGSKNLHTCGVATNGFAYCWGRNNTGQLGDGTTAASAIPVRVAGQ